MVPLYRIQLETQPCRHGDHHEAHDGEDDEAGEEEFWGAADVDEGAADEGLGFWEERVGELWAVVDGEGGRKEKKILFRPTEEEEDGCDLGPYIIFPSKVQFPYET